MQRPLGGGFFERAVVVGRSTDVVHGVVLEVEFEDATRVQRVWPSPGIRLLKYVGGVGLGSRRGAEATL